MIIRNANVYIKNKEFKKKDIIIHNGRIAENVHSGSREEIINAEGLYAIPGLVDIHFHGAAGYDFCDADEAGLQAIAEYEAQNGILAICPATMSYAEEKLNAIIDTATAHQNRSGADLVGIHMEGPFINPQMARAQNAKYLMNPDINMLHRLCKRGKGLIKIISIAPELDGAMEFIEACKDLVNISLAHTCADYEQAKKAFSLGAKHITHLYNAMPDISHRNPGPIAAAWETRAETELIADGVHIHPSIVQMTFHSFGAENMILISDSMRACGLFDAHGRPNERCHQTDKCQFADGRSAHEQERNLSYSIGQYELGGQSVTVYGKKAVLTNAPETIAGSVTNLFDCMRKAVLDMGIPLEQAVRAASENPAKAIGIDADYGSLETGRYGNVLLVDKALHICKIIQKGKIIRDTV